jgi:F420-non-reducing hydrogenase iron-sulfur subunit
VEYAQKLLEDIGLEGSRVKMTNLSAAMGTQFAETATKFTEEIRSLGPNPLKNVPDNNGVERLMEDFKSKS